MIEYYLIAKIVALHGKEGFVKVISFSDFPERFFKLKNVYLDFFGSKKLFAVDAVKKHKDFFLMKFKNFNSNKESEILLHKEVYVDKENLVELPKDYFFIHDLIGSKVIKDNNLLGTIKDVLTYPANDVYVVVGKENEEILIPAVLDFIESFDPEKKILVLKPGESLYDEDED